MCMNGVMTGMEITIAEVIRQIRKVQVLVAIELFAVAVGIALPDLVVCPPVTIVLLPTALMTVLVFVLCVPNNKTYILLEDE